ncbi:MAG: phosphotransferase, partial [Alphaproteobacteria bacterium]
MAVYTPVSDQDLSDFLQNYDIGEVIGLTEITEGVENSNFILKTSLDSYILTLYEKRVSADDLPFFMKLISELYIRDISCPKPIKNKYGNIISK